jgi:hypothetical protein
MSHASYKQSHSTLVMPDLIRHPEALDSGFRRNDGASDNNETVNKSWVNRGFAGPIPMAHGSQSKRLAAITRNMSGSEA